jgi:8-oxo-dGTP pyrophosphatase MutT (NUDIX family)
LKHQDKILLTKRSELASVAPGVWNVPAGKVKFHEVPVEAALREVQEETNMAVPSLTEIHIRTFEGKANPFTLVIHIADVQAQRISVNDEHSDIQVSRKS